MKSKLLISLMLFLLIFNCKKDDNKTLPSNNTNGKSTAIFNPNVTYGTLTDQDGNTYKTVLIGTQTWMAENLRTTKYRNGTSIPNVTDGSLGSNSVLGSYQYNKNEFYDIATYGYLYNWYAINDIRNLAPIGWHVPTHEELTTFRNYLGEDIYAGGKIKEKGTTHWSSPNYGATNETGFTALPGESTGTVGEYGKWWSSSENDDGNAWYFGLNYQKTFFDVGSWGKQGAVSVRCVKD